MSDLSGANETLTRERVKEIFREKQYSYLEQKVELPRSYGRFVIAEDIFLTGIQEPHDHDRGEGTDRGAVQRLQNRRLGRRGQESRRYRISRRDCEGPQCGRAATNNVSVRIIHHRGAEITDDFFTLILGCPLCLTQLNNTLARNVVRSILSANPVTLNALPETHVRSAAGNRFTPDLIAPARRARCRRLCPERFLIRSRRRSSDRRGSPQSPRSSQAD